MSQPSQPEPSRSGDAWHAFSLLVAGVGFYRLVGWLLDRWLGTSFLVVVGILLGAVLGLYTTYKRFSPGRDRPTD
jgi:F0F1-type ATP synthase assembly protein I